MILLFLQFKLKTALAVPDFSRFTFGHGSSRWASFDAKLRAESLIRSWPTSKSKRSIRKQEKEEGEIFMRCFSFSKRSWYGKTGAAAVPIAELCRFFCILDRMDQTYLNECMHNSTGQFAQLFCYAILRCFQRSLIFFVQRYLQRRVCVSLWEKP